MARNIELQAASGLHVCRRQVARHISQVFVLVIPVALAIITATVLGPLLLLLAAEGFLLGVLPLVPSFQRRVQEQLERDERLAKLAERARLMPAIAAGHRSELEELESIVPAIRVRTGCSLDREDWLGMDALLTLYLRLALAHRKSTEAAFSTAGAADLDRQMANAEQARWAAPEAARARIEQHLAILQRRRELRVTMDERRAVLSCDLAAIADLIRCLHEECIAAEGARASSEVPDAIAEGLRGGAALNEVALLRASFIDDLEGVEPPNASGAPPAPRADVARDRRCANDTRQSPAVPALTALPVAEMSA
ncbi:MAG: hypothetical protein NVS3B10_28180 [Polyangiales bacterium]